MANSFRSNSAVDATRSSNASEIGAGLMGKGVPVGLIQLGAGPPRKRNSISFRNKENDAAATSAFAMAAVQ